MKSAVISLAAAATMLLTACESRERSLQEFVDIVNEDHEMGLSNITARRDGEYSMALILDIDDDDNHVNRSKLVIMALDTNLQNSFRNSIMHRLTDDNEVVKLLRSADLQLDLVVRCGDVVYHDMISKHELNHSRS